MELAQLLIHNGLKTFSGRRVSISTDDQPGRIHGDGELKRAFLLYGNIDPKLRQHFVIGTLGKIRV
ncbi:hypothetical protein PAALTS15_18168 [Paenibacillus alvei TS-15]|uniref:Uncharacterized protein n=1 Tax=Paenibacillus alvei TS-15 TaxID=1117108 RepID=S9SIW0_PAEAL|nr:hypothetical protein PAALTS15_18168 [Paenibacillus alvei TS-15]